MVKYLIIRFSSIGDIVLTTPVIRALKQQVEEAEIHFLTKKNYASILQSNPYIDKLHLLDNNLPELTKTLKEEFFDYIIDLHHNLRTLRIKNSLSVIDFSFNKLNFQKWLLVNFGINRLPNVHIVDRYLDTTKVFDVTNDQKGLDFFIPENDEVNRSAFPSSFQSQFVAFAIGAQHATKRLPREKILSICKKINKPIVFLGDKNDSETAEYLVNNLGANTYNACGKFNLNQSASIVKQADWVITHDTGLMHIAAAFKKRIVSIWGNTVPAFGMYPYLPDEDSISLEVKDLKCRPCSKIGFSRCPKKHFKCMNDIDENVVANAVNGK